MMAMHMLMGADSDRFGSTIADFECAYLMQQKNAYPKSLHDFYMLLKDWSKQLGMKQYPQNWVCCLILLMTVMMKAPHWSIKETNTRGHHALDGGTPITQLRNL